MSAVIRFPPRRSACVWLLPARDEDGWLVLHAGHGWLHGDRRSALEDAVWIANSSGLRRIIFRNWGRA